MSSDEVDSPKEGLLKFKERLCTEAEGLVKDCFPSQVLALDKLFNSEMFQLKCLDDFTVEKIFAGVDFDQVSKSTAFAEPPAKRRREVVDLPSTNGTLLPLPLNQGIVRLADVIKPHIQELMCKCNLVKIWIQLLIPRVEDGNNFGVSVQEDTVGEVTRIEGEVTAYLDAISRYFITRGKLLSKVLKYPQLDDYKLAVAELDQKEFLALRLTCCEMRNAYCILHDTITKNIEKIKTPRSSNIETMY